jgi:5-oxoprolinase (ATP-hydrolysing)
MSWMWMIRADTGGTFTDAFALGPDGVERRLKVLSSGVVRARVGRAEGCRLWLEGLPATSRGTWAGFRIRVLPDGAWSRVVASNGAELELDGPAPVAAGAWVELTSDEDAPVLAARLLTGTPPGQPLPPLDWRVATTRATNALLEGKGAPVAWFVTAGFEDLLRIGDQRRPDLFALVPEAPRPLHWQATGVAGRLAADGSELEPLDAAGAAAAARAMLREKPDAVAAVSLLHAQRNPAHERALEMVLREAGFRHVSLSSVLAPFIRLLPRAQTTVVNAALAPVIEDFTGALQNVMAAAAANRLLLMNSAGGLDPAADFRPMDALLSGPAGGVAGAWAVARAAGFHKVITLDMGGTSTDVARLDGGPVFQFEHAVGGARLLAPAVRIESVAAGGGSICCLRDGRLQVGPDSAGSDPGPACYGRGGPLTVTDLNLLLGHFDPARAPVPLDPAASAARLDELRGQLATAGQPCPEPLALAAGLRDLAIEIMADAMRRVSVREGVDPGGHALLAFGGAGPQHACEVAARLGCRTVLVPADAGLLSAFGLHAAAIERIAAREILRPLAEVAPALAAILEELETAALAGVAAAGGNNAATQRQIASLRLAGQESAIDLEFTDPGELAAAFAAAYERLYHYPPPPRPVELVGLHVVAAAARADLPAESFPAGPGFSGPLLIQDGFSTCRVPDGWVGRRGSQGTLLLERAAAPAAGGAAAAPPAGLATELFRARFTAVTGEMGDLLARTALSTNIRERRDFSCALLDPACRLVVNAPHIPVHLGALGLCVETVAAALDLAPGEVAITNHPGFGGSHLPDITLLAPVHDRRGGLVGWLANRAHHAEIGGLAPGSMPPAARCLAEEGVVIAPRKLVVGGRARWDEIGCLLESGPWPSRNPAENLADLRAQLSALEHARTAVAALADTFGTGEIHFHMEAIAAHAAAAMAAALDRFDWSQPRRGRDALDDGAPVAVTLRRDPGGRLTVDFAGSAGRHPGNFNATPAIVRSAVLYVLRLLAARDLPLNDGLARDVGLLVPAGSLLDPGFPSDPLAAPPVVAGNVETSQHVVHALLDAFGAAAFSQGTMNNVLFGAAGFAHYETIGGGCGAAPGRPGASGLHSHMTNTAITDPEILEARFPVRLRRFGLRRGSGGAGRWPGGDGLVREYEFLAPLTLSLVTSKRAAGPRGLAGGGAGRPGKNEFRPAGGDWRDLPGVATLEVAAGDRLRVGTPGGGGCGAPPATA